MSLRRRLTAILQSAVPQTKSPSNSEPVVGGGKPNRDEPPKDNYARYRSQYRSFPLSRAGIDLRATEVVEPGYRVEADNDETQEFLEDWLSTAAVYAGETGEDFLPLLWQIARDYDLDGTVLIEHVYDNPENPQQITALKQFDPQNTDFLTYPGSSRLILPDDDEDAPRNTQENAAGENASYMQNPNEWGFDDENEVHLSQNDVTKIVRRPSLNDSRDPAGHRNAEFGPNRGVSLVEAVSDEIERTRSRLQDYNASIASQAYPRLSVKFEDYQIGEGPNAEVIQWDSDAMQDFIDGLTRDESEKRYKSDNDWKDPGGTLGTPPGVESEFVHGEVPDIMDSLQYSVDYILSGLNVPKYAVGFGGDINRRISEEQETRFEQSIQATRRHLERKLTPILERVAEMEGHSTDGIQLKIEPEESENPLKSEDFDADEFKKVLDAISNFSNSNANMIISDWQDFLGDLLNMDLSEYGDPEDVRKSLQDMAGDLNESDPQVQDQFNSQQQDGQADQEADNNGNSN